MSEPRVTIGQIVAPHGVRGELKLRPLTDFPSRFYDMPELSLYRKGQFVNTYHVLNVRDQLTRGCLLLTLHGVDDMNAAEALRGCTVEIGQDERVPLPEGEYWESDLIGFDAVSDTGTPLGTVKDIVSGGSSQLFVIADEHGKDHYIPVASEFFLEADLRGKTVTLHLIEGLWDL